MALTTDIILDEETHDIDLSRGGKLHSSNTKSLGQKIKISILMRKGEWPRNVNLGVPYSEGFFETKNNKAVIDSYLRGHILKVDGVETLQDFRSILNNKRQLEVEFTVKTTSGTIENYLIGF